jgi:hypothetical protein
VACSRQNVRRSLKSEMTLACQWMVMSVCFDNLKFFKQFLCPALRASAAIRHLHHN